MQIIKHISAATDKSKKNATRPIKIADKILPAAMADESAIIEVTTKPIPPAKSAFLFLQKHFRLIQTGVKRATPKAAISVNTPTPKATQRAIVILIITPKKKSNAAATPNKIPAVIPAAKQLIQISVLSLASQQ